MFANLKALTMRANIWSLTAMLAFSISTLSTGYGAFVSLSQTTLAPNAAVAVAAGAASTFISLLAFVAWRTCGGVFRMGKYVTAVLILTVGLAISLTSVAFSGGGILFWTQKGALQSHLAVTAATTVSRPISAFADRLSQIETATTLLNQYASQRSSVEAAVGGTCSAPAIVGAGPLTRMRAKHASDAALHAGTAQTLQRDAIGVLALVSSAQNQTEVGSAYAQARTIVNDGRLSTIRHWAVGLQRQLVAGQFFFEGATRACPDPEMLALVRQVISELNVPVSLPDTVPVVADPDLFRTIEIAVSQVVGRFSRGDELASQLSFSIVPILLIATLIDLVGLVSAIAIGRQPEVIAGGDLSYRHRLRWHLNSLRWDSGDKSYFIVPLDGDAAVSIEAVNIAIRYGLARVPGMTGMSEKEISAINSYEAQRLKAVSGGATRFTGYLFNETLLEEWRNVERLLKFDKLSYSYGRPPSSGPNPPSLTPIDGGLARA